MSGIPEHVTDIASASRNDPLEDDLPSMLRDHEARTETRWTSFQRDQESKWASSSQELAELTSLLSQHKQKLSDLDLLNRQQEKTLSRQEDLLSQQQDFLRRQAQKLSLQENLLQKQAAELSYLKEMMQQQQNKEASEPFNDIDFTSLPLPDNPLFETKGMSQLKPQLQARTSDSTSLGVAPRSDDAGRLETVLNHIGQQVAEMGADIQAFKTQTSNDIQTLKTHSKSDLDNLKTLTEVDLNALKTQVVGMGADIQAFKTQTSNDIQTIKTQSKSDLANLKTLTEVDLNALKTQTSKDILALKTQTANDLNAFKSKANGDIQTLKNSNSQQDLAIQDAQSSTFVHWGSSTCAGLSHTVYSGVVGGSWFNDSGAASNYLCLTMAPVLSHRPLPPLLAYLFGGEYETHDSHQELDPVCAVCRSTLSTTVMIPGTNVCTPGWHLQYWGYLMAGRKDHLAASEYICVDAKMQSTVHSKANENGKLLYYTVTQCGALPCGPYVNNTVVVCAVCSK